MKFEGNFSPQETELLLNMEKETLDAIAAGTAVPTPVQDPGCFQTDHAPSPLQHPAPIWQDYTPGIGTKTNYRIAALIHAR